MVSGVLKEIRIYDDYSNLDSTYKIAKPEMNDFKKIKNQA